MITLDQNGLDELVKAGAKVSVRVTEPKPPPVAAELVDLLQQMVQVNRTVALALSKSATAFPVSPPQLAPVVHVAAPSVNLSPHVEVARPSEWEFTVTDWIRPPGTPPTAPMRIHKIIAKIIK